MTMLSAGEFKQQVCGLENGQKITRRSAINVRDGAGVFEKVLGAGRYRRVLEIGTYRGVSAAFISQFVDHVDTIDLKHGQLEQNGDQFDRHRLWQSLGIDNIALHLIENDKEKVALIAGLDFDFAFIDGDHVAPSPQRDFELVRHCGAVLFHDYDGDNGVTKFVATLPQKQITKMDIFALWQR